MMNESLKMAGFGTSIRIPYQKIIKYIYVSKLRKFCTGRKMGVRDKKEEKEMYKKKITIYVQTPIIAPALPTIRIFKSKKIETLLSCYKDLYKENPEVEKILEAVKHLDRAFERAVILLDNKTICQPFMPSTVVSGLLQKKLDPSIYVRGMISIPPESIIIDMKKRSESLLVTEEIVPGTVLTGEVYINKDVTKSIMGGIYSMTQKGYGQVLVTFS